MAYGYTTGEPTAVTRNQMTERVQDALMEAFEELGGVPALVRWAKENPTAFYGLLGKMMPMEIHVSGTPMLMVLSEERQESAEQSVAFPRLAAVMRLPRDFSSRNTTGIGVDR
jgi:hypothetical protein